MIHKIWFLDQIVKAGDFKTASSILGVTPSALTQSVKTLENHFEKTFLIREKGNIALTSEGEALLEKFSSVLGELEGLDQEYSEQDGPKKIRIGAYDSLAIRYLPKLYSNILDVNPNVKIDLQIGRSAELITLTIEVISTWPLLWHHKSRIRTIRPLSLIIISQYILIKRILMKKLIFIV